MSKKDPALEENDFALFQEAVKGIKQLSNDTIITTRRQRPKADQRNVSTKDSQNHEFYFSDEFEPHLSEHGPMQYARSDVSKYEVKKLRRGVYVPDIYLDMHGMTQQEAKRELAAMIAACIKDGVSCACVMHGIGKHILKQKAPLWLAQHPDVMAFHQAPLEFGGAGALLVLIEIPER
ncbi:endonuclease SmrB [Photobacterium sp. 1_MG-2023]|uniref:endonuclease SmrB n=1 Tax=Photobacterium sp. 1_MG-2023 TaxID=3062646 RepID=UPI0026E37DB2|nr:endonuclease SmrB [Photobacterium sp. 1_MG-2023]MDO6705145.1 endonuclease SmrB [Photobacterium sp. 1_MG-2023]